MVAYSITLEHILVINLINVVECVVEMVHYRTTLEHIQLINLINVIRGRRDRMVVRFTNTYMRAVPITTKVVSSNPANGEVYSIQHYVIKFVSDLQQVGGFLRFPQALKLAATIELKYC